MRLGIEAELIVCEEALREFPDDETFQYRRAVQEFYISQERNNKTYLHRACSHFLSLLQKHPESDIYKGYLAQIYHALGRQEEAISTAKSCKDREALLDMILEGEELICHRQNKLYHKMQELIGMLRKYNTKESLAVEKEIRRIYFGDAAEYCCSLWFTYYRLGEIYLSEGDGEKYEECMEMAYELAKLEDEMADEPYTSPLTDRIKKFRSDPSELDQFLTVNFDPCHANVLKKRIVEENFKSYPLTQQNKRQLVGFFDKRAHCDDANLIDYSTNWCMTLAEHEQFMESFVKESKKGNNASILLNVRSMKKAISLIEQGRLKGMFAGIGHLVAIGFCNCMKKTNYAALPIGEAECAINTADCENDKIFSIVSLDVDVSFRECGVEERLIEDCCNYAREKGFLYAETYIDYRSPNHERDAERYKSLGFYPVREFDNMGVLGIILQKKLT